MLSRLVGVSATDRAANKDAKVGVRVDSNNKDVRVALAWVANRAGSNLPELRSSILIRTGCCRPSWAGAKLWTRNSPSGWNKIEHREWSTVEVTSPAIKVAAGDKQDVAADKAEEVLVAARVVAADKAEVDAPVVVDQEAVANNRPGGVWDEVDTDDAESAKSSSMSVWAFSCCVGSRLSHMLLKSFVPERFALNKCVKELADGKLFGL